MSPLDRARSALRILVTETPRRHPKGPVYQAELICGDDGIAVGPPTSCRRDADDCAMFAANLLAELIEADRAER